MNTTIKSLNKQLSKSNADISEIESKLQTAWYEVFQDSRVIKAMVSKVEISEDYMFDIHGEIASYTNVDLSEFKDCKPYFESYMREYHFVDTDWKNDTLSMSQGESIIIQDDTRRDNGVWLNGKRVIDESEYKVDGEVDETNRNRLIEAYMTETGFFPGVFRCDSHGNIFLVNTQK